MKNMLDALKTETNYTLTENGGITHKTTQSALLDMFAMGAAMRERSDEDVILMFQKAYDENPELAMKMLFYIRDIRGGQGERRFFRVCMRWLTTHHLKSARINLKNIPEFGRWDDLYCLVDTPLEQEMFSFMHEQIKLDLDSTTPSLLAKWLKSENASSKETISLARKTYLAFGMTPKEYRKVLTKLRSRIKIVETLMSQNRWDEIEFDKIPSRAGLIYKNAFARRDIIQAKYRDFIMCESSGVKAKTLYPYEVVHEAIKKMYERCDMDDIDRLAINKYWDNLTDYFNDASLNALCMVDTSGSMSGRPIEVATSLGLYCAEKAHGPFANHYISFSSRPQLIECEGVDFCDKVWRIVRTDLCENTNIEAAFEMLLSTAQKYHMKQEDLPQNILVISDMEFDEAAHPYVFSWSIHQQTPSWTGLNTENVETVMEGISRKWKEAGYKMPHIIYWNVNARHNNIPMIGEGHISYVSGFSPSIFSVILTGKTGWDLMMEAISRERYKDIHAWA